MGGVNTHNQLHLATQYSLMKNLVFKMWYKVFYIGMVDMALTNTYILYNHLLNENLVSHFEFLTAIQSGLLSAENFVLTGVETCRASRRQCYENQQHSSHHQILEPPTPMDCVVFRQRLE